MDIGFFLLLDSRLPWRFPSLSSLLLPSHFKLLAASWDFTRLGTTYLGKASTSGPGRTPGLQHGLALSSIASITFSANYGMFTCPRLRKSMVCLTLKVSCEELVRDALIINTKETAPVRFANDVGNPVHSSTLRSDPCPHMHYILQLNLVHFQFLHNSNQIPSHLLHITI